MSDEEKKNEGLKETAANDEQMQEDNKFVKFTQSKWLTVITVGLVILAGLSMILNRIINKPLTHLTNNKEAKTSSVGMPEDLLVNDSLWQKHLEARQEEYKAELALQREENQRLIAALTERLKNLQETMVQNQNERSEQIADLLMNREVSSERDSQIARNFGLTDVLPTTSAEDSLPKDISIYIPASTYVQGWLLSGIAVPTGVSIQSNPMPVIIRLNDDANLPGGFKSNLKGCKIVGSCYGDLSSERVLIRTETLVCVDPVSRQSITTKIAGFVVGPDGVTGLRGKVAEVNKKYIGSAIAGGILGGLGRVAKTSGETIVSPLGMMSQARQSFTDNFKNESLSSAGDVANKISDYYIKKAESIAPVLQVPAGVRLDVVFTEGVFFGQLNTKEKVVEQRKASFDLPASQSKAKNINN